MKCDHFKGMRSIKQNTASQPLPDFRNLGVMLRILLGVNAIALAAALLTSNGVAGWLQQYVDLAAWVQPLLLLNMALLALLAGVLQRLPLPAGQAAVVLLAACSSALMPVFWALMGIDDGSWGRMLRAGLLGAMVATTMLAYFALRAFAFSPALSEARLQALTARIRPHFLFNSLNAVLSLIRDEPRRAEKALEDLAELFRALMRDHRELLPLADEVALCRQYLELEKLRLGERLQVVWEDKELPGDLPVPPLMLQPLLENAVYHGIEPVSEPGTLSIRFLRRGEELHIDLSNPCPPAGIGPILSGNHMALNNIRERLALYYDLEARLDAGESCSAEGGKEYRVHIVLPCRTFARRTEKPAS